MRASDGKGYLRLVVLVSLASLALIAGLSYWMLGTRTLRAAVTQTSAPDGCVACHNEPKDDPGGVHAAALVGCAACHLGNREATTAEAAHAGMEPEPGALSTVKQTCGSCHAREAERVATSLMATGRGIISVDRWAFGEIPTPDAMQPMADVLAKAQPSPAEDHVRRLCGGCHLGARKDNRDDAVRGVGSGCSACHVATRKHETDPHPVIFGVVPDRQCLGCHSRSARISLSYQGLAEISAPTACDKPTKLFDGRSGCKLGDDVHHAGGLECVDCHVHSELMGDGVARPRARQQLEIQCETCHGPAKDARWKDVKDPISRDLLRLRDKARAPDERVRLGRRGTPVYNLRSVDGGWQLFPKAGGAPLIVRATPQDPSHQMKGHERLSCAACHSAWIPTCSSCHTSFDPKGKQWDFGRGAEAAGAWLEENDGMGYGPPGLAVAPGGKIEPAAPGMIARLDARAAGGKLADVRLVSTFDPHTTVKAARDCASCHRSARALGLGSGQLELSAAGPRFTPERPVQGVAHDGWTALFPKRPAQGTSAGARGLDAAEQRRVLQVGACSECHTHAGDAIWRDFAASVQRLRRGAPKCKGRVPAWFAR